MAPNEKVQNLMATVTERIADAIRDGIANPAGWSAPWHRVDLNPVNAVTGKPYTSGNRLVLALATLDQGAEPFWATYRQWESVNAQVRKGEKASYIIRPASKKVVDDAGEASYKLIGWRVHPVFHSGQVDGWEAPTVEKPDTVDADTVAAAFDWAQHTGATIVESDTAGASYSPTFDKVTIPARDRWTDVDGAWSTIAHELAHWTGHESRLNRSLANRFGDEAYAAEELIAELSAAFTMTAIGRTAEPRADHAHYLAHWLKVLDASPDALWTAASAAEKATGFVLDKIAVRTGVAA